MQHVYIYIIAGSFSRWDSRGRSLPSACLLLSSGWSFPSLGNSLSGAATLAERLCAARVWSQEFSRCREDVGGDRVPADVSGVGRAGAGKGGGPQPASPS